MFTSIKLFRELNVWLSWYTCIRDPLTQNYERVLIVHVHVHVHVHVCLWHAFSVSCFLLVLPQVILVRELFPARADVLHSQVFRINVAFEEVFSRERLRAVGTHKSLLSVDHRRSRRPVEILQGRK